VQIFRSVAFKPEQINQIFILFVDGPAETGNHDAAGQRGYGLRDAPPSRGLSKIKQGLGATVEPLQKRFHQPETIKNLWLLMGAVGFILLIACVKRANSFYSRGTVRQKEIAVRAAMGATRWQLFSQVF